VDLHVGTTLEDIATRTPGGLGALQSIGLHKLPLDRTPLAAACERLGMEPSTVLRLLGEAARQARGRGEVPMAELDATELVGRIAREHHARCFESAHLALALARRLAPGGHPVLATVVELVETLVVELHAHMDREERSVLSRVRALVRGTPVKGARAGDLARGMHAMELDHQATALLLDELRARADGFRAPPDASQLWRGLYELLEELEADIRRAIWVEERLFFPLVRELEAEREV
jgi:iron-sulfur cluster repair protein YtfE (RIC family)